MVVLAGSGTEPPVGGVYMIPLVDLPATIVTQLKHLDNNTSEGFENLVNFVYENGNYQLVRGSTMTNVTIKYSVQIDLDIDYHCYPLQ